MPGKFWKIIYALGFFEELFDPSLEPVNIHLIKSIISQSIDILNSHLLTDCQFSNAKYGFLKEKRYLGERHS